MTLEIILHDQYPWKYRRGLESNSQPLDLQLDSLLTALRGPIFGQNLEKMILDFSYMEAWVQLK